MVGHPFRGRLVAPTHKSVANRESTDREGFLELQRALENLMQQLRKSGYKIAPSSDFA
jgi:sirohydrochlorin ferrochelatase